MADHRTGDRLALALFATTVAAAIFIYGVAVGRFEVFPFGTLDRLYTSVRTVLTGETDSWYVQRVDHDRPGILNEPGAYDGLNLVTRFVNDTTFRADILDMDGNLVHRWNTDWFELWSDADHIPDLRVPRRRPGTHIHGAVVLEDGDLVFNFEHLGLIRLDREGQVVWRLPYPTHHSVHRAESGNLWVSGQVDHDETLPRFPQRSPPFSEYTALEISPEGEILEAWSIARILQENDLQGLLHMGNTRNWNMEMGDADLLHLNDVEPFPDSLQEGVFRRGDVMVSLRNVNAILVFNRDTRKVRYLRIGGFVRQHDPDFLDGDRISIYDNNNVGAEEGEQHSRIVILDAAADTVSVWFEGDSEIPFYSDVMGKHQWLPNGNLLVTESTQGRAFELDGNGDLVWEFNNFVGPRTVGLVEEVQRIPGDFRAVFGSGGGDPGN